MSERTGWSGAGPLSLAFVNSTRKWGGVKTWTLDFGRALQERGHRITVLVRPGTPFVAACREAGFATHTLRFGPKYNPLAIARCARILRRARADLAVVNISKDLNVGAVAARLLGLPVLHRVGLVEDFKNSVEERWRQRFLVDRILVPSRYLRDGLLRNLRWLDPRGVVYIPNSKDLGRFPEAAPGRDGVPMFGVSSQLSSSKGHTYLLQALEQLQHSGTTVRLRVAGTGPLEAALRAEVEDRGLTETVEFCGFQRDMGAFLAGLHGYVLPSLNESFSNAVLEAMAAGLPVVAFAAGGVPEVVGEAGVLVPPKDCASLAAALGRLAAAPRLRAELGRAARQRVAAEYDLQRNAAALEALLRGMAGL